MSLHILEIATLIQDPWYIYRGVRNDSETTVRYIAAEIEFFADLQNHIEQGEIIPLDEAERNYALKMKEHEIKYESRYANVQTTRRWLRQKIEKNVKFIQFTLLPNKPTMIHSKMQLLEKHTGQTHMRT